MPPREQRRATALGGGNDPVVHVVAVPQPGEHVQRRDDVGARLEDAHDVVEVGAVRHVAHAVQREQRVDVVGRRDREGIEAAQRTDVTTDLVA